MWDGRQLQTVLPQVIQLCRPSDSRLEHVDFECLFSSLSLRLLLRVFASLLLERRVIFTADKLRLASPAALTPLNTNDREDVPC